MGGKGLYGRIAAMRRRGMDAITIGGLGPIADQNDFIYIHRCPSPPKKPIALFPALPLW